jgi:hypothetical protein
VRIGADRVIKDFSDYMFLQQVRRDKSKLQRTMETAPRIDKGEGDIWAENRKIPFLLAQGLLFYLFLLNQILLDKEKVRESFVLHFVLHLHQIHNSGFLKAVGR